MQPQVVILLLAMMVVGFFATQKKEKPEKDAPPVEPTIGGRAPSIDPSVDACQAFYDAHIEQECGSKVRFVEYAGGPVVGLAGATCSIIYQNYLTRRKSCNVFGPAIAGPGMPGGFVLPVQLGKTTWNVSYP